MNPMLMTEARDGLVYPHAFDDGMNFTDAPPDCYWSDQIVPDVTMAEAVAMVLDNLAPGENIIIALTVDGEPRVYTMAPIEDVLDT